MKADSIGLIVEGGGMRGAYAAGILEAFLDHELSFPYAIGVSAGANTLCSYLSGQKGRNERLYTKWIADKRFIGWQNLFKEGGYFGMDFLFDDLPKYLDPFDFEAFKQTSTLFKVGVTHCKSGQARYFEPAKVATLDEANRILRASSSLPFISKMVDIEGEYYLDGGLCDSIPIQQSLADGNKKNVLVLTRNADYRKQYSKQMHRLAKIYGRNYPEVVHCIATRYQHYNHTLDRIAQLEAEGSAFILRPVMPLEVDRFEKSVDKLKVLFEQGYQQASDALPALKDWIQIT